MKCFGERIRNYHCKVVLLDDQELIQEIQSTSLGQELLENIFKHLNLIETSYFGLRFIDTTDQTHWLDPGKKTIKQLEGTESYTLYFGVKFYAADPCKLVEEITRYQFFLQIKQDILQGRLLVPNDLSAELCAYAVQSELGDFDPRRHGLEYISEFQFTSAQSPEIETKIGELHKAMLGQVPAVAELNYLEKVKWLEMYGVDLHPVLGEDNTDYFLGLTPAGVIVLRNKTKVGNYFWPRITKLNQKGKYFMLRVKNKNNEEQTYGFETPSKAACKHLWKCATEHHAFFRLLQLPSSSKSYSLNFRDSARSDGSARRRAQPQFVRTPSRRYQRRIVEGAQDDSETKESEATNQGFKRIMPGGVKPVEGGNVSNLSSAAAANYRAESPKSTRSASWAAPKPKQIQPSVPSPKSVRSAGVGSSHVNRERSGERHHHHRSRKRSGSGESHSSGDSPSRRRHRHRRRSRRASDAESEASRNSGRSHGKKRHHKSGSISRHGESGSESENCSRKHRHRHRKSSDSKKYELVDSEAQWKEVQKKQSQQAVQQAAVVQSSGNLVNLPVAGGNASSKSHTITATPSRKSGYMNSGMETASEVSYAQTRRRHRRTHRSSSPDKRLSSELKRHLDFELVDTNGMTEEERKEIPYVQVETTQGQGIKSGRIRHSSSVKSNRLPAQDHQSIVVTEVKTSNPTSDVKIAEFGICNPDSPPPPYSPPSAGSNNPAKPPVPQKLVISNLGSSPGTKMMQPTKADSRGSLLANGGNPQAKNAAEDRRQRNVGTGQSIKRDPSSKGHYVSNDQKRSVPSHNELGLPAQSFYPSPSESPDSQKVDSHHENSDSGLGTDHQEYYKNENFSSLGYEISPRKAENLARSEFDGSKLCPNVASAKQSSNYWSNLTRAQPQVRQSWEVNKVIVPSMTLRLPNSEMHLQQQSTRLPQQPHHQSAPTKTIHEISTEL